MRRALIALAVMGALIVLAADFTAQQALRPSTGPGFEVYEASISQLQDALSSGKVTSKALVEAYLARIKAYDDDTAGPQLNAIIATNPNAIKDAEMLDRERVQKGPRGPLHGIPVIVKDNYNTTDMPTTASSIALAGFIPREDAFQVRKLREAGAVIIAKSNMHELASGITTISSYGGQTRNPYDLRRNPGGSSGGTGAAIAASFAAVGMGSDTCGSIRIPSSQNNLVGLRPTKGLSSIHGIIPLSVSQDVGGPLARSVMDLAITLDATIGEDTADAATKLASNQQRPNFVKSLRTDALKDTRLGVLKPLFGDGSDDPEVGRIVQSAVNAMKAQGAVPVDVTFSELTGMLANTSVIDLEFREDFENYLREYPGAPVRSLQDLLDQGLLHNVIEGTMRRKLASKGRESEDYRTAMAKRAALQQTVLKVMRDEKLDAFVYPTMRRRPAIIGEAQDGSTCQLSASTGFPAISIPAGLTTSGLPIGVELLGAPLQDAKLVAYAYAFEQSTPHRQSPPLTPPLMPGGATPRLTWDAVATGSEVIPAVSSTLRIPIHLEFNVTTNELRYSLTGVSNEILYVTLHRAASGKNGPVTESLLHSSSAAAGAVFLSEVDRKNLTAGELYISIATRKFPRGELRAQLRPN